MDATGIRFNGTLSPYAKIEYALERSRRGYIDCQSGIQVFSETLYRIKTKFPDAGFTRHRMQRYVAHVWEGRRARRRQSWEMRCRWTMLGSPRWRSFYASSARATKDVFVASSTCIDDDKLRLVRGMITQHMGGIHHASSGGVYFVLDREQTRLSTWTDFKKSLQCSLLAQIKFEQLCGQTMKPPVMPRTARKTPLEQTIPPVWERWLMVRLQKLEDIRKMYVASLQNAQSKYYQLVHEMSVRVKSTRNCWWAARSKPRSTA